MAATNATKNSTGTGTEGGASDFGRELLRVLARAICGAEGCYDPDEVGGHRWGTDEPNWMFHVTEARACLSALLAKLEMPSSRMNFEGHAAMELAIAGEMDRGMVHKPVTPAIWQAMLAELKREIGQEG